MAHRTFKEGFTIVELLVVITIIGLLVAIMVPAINIAIESGRRANCQHNAKSVATALISHHLQNRKMPKETGNIGGRPWAGMILDEMGRQDLYDQWDEGLTGLEVVEQFLCPSDEVPDTENADDTKYPISYLANDLVIRDDRAAKLSEFRNLSNTILLAESTLKSGQKWHGGTSTFKIPDNGIILSTLDSKHGDEIIMAFCDGSAKQIPKDTEWSIFKD